LKNDREATRRDFRYTPLDALPFAVAQQRPDFLLSDYNIYTYDIVLTDLSGTAGAARYEADLEVHGAYVQAEAELIPRLRLQAGVRYEKGTQIVAPADLFASGGTNIIPSRSRNNYFLPAATLTWNFAEDQQLRLHASKTIARPQFRELAPQQYSDPETDRTFFGNQFLTDSELLNAEARYEYYFARDQLFSLAGFYKKIDRPIEAVAFQQGGTFFTTFANAPEAQLYGAEVELKKYFPLADFIGGSLFAARRGVLIGNYTYSKSEIKVADDDTTIPVGTGGAPVPAGNVFNDGTPLTGQSKHLVNFQLGLENTDRLSQQTLLLTYASRRVTNRGPNGQPDLVEQPGLRLDFVAREGFSLWGRSGEIKFEARNLTGEGYQEFQTLNGSRIDNNSYDQGRSFSLGISLSL
jgi:outer membrane receptor protein involved in Fe transport